MSYVALATTTLGSSAASVSFSSIPATYKDLILILDGTVNDFVNVLVSLNGDGSNVYSRLQMTTNGSTASSGSGTHPGLYMVFGAPSERVFAQMQLMDYSATNKQKTALSRGYTFGSETAARVLRWPSNAAVNSMTVTAQTGTFLTGSRLSLYGVA
jgi:hypothetical protein